ncbi:hypothetical protein [Entomomonas asaccharolytica]|uniref:Uncharacterized protein n=1 Tax=Entomomonas asaccharolytica TaxID=2785331 RepID=A0A974RWD9_9GAMM|nr:hypothetical protein [Entomomonas asaccharolytica]QQP85085.1 hypothetical protein JHT90_11915 [Entomomonas asaccharolytica]
MLGGGAYARLLGKAGVLANNPVARGAIGEGLVGAGQTAEQIRQENPDNLLTGKQSLASAASGLTTGLIGYGGGRLAQKIGILDPQTLLAGGSQLPKGLSQKTFSNIIKGAISEGAFQELPQSATEQMWQNYAQDKPLLESVPEAAATGLLAGGFMGAGANLAHSRHSRPEQQSPTTSKELLKLGYDATPKLGYEGLQPAPDIIYQGTDYQPPPPAQIGFDNPNNPQSANFNPNLSNQYDPVIEGLNKQADFYGMPEPSKPSGTITKALWAGGLGQQQNLQSPVVDNVTNQYPTTPTSEINQLLPSTNQVTSQLDQHVNLPKQYEPNSKAKEVTLNQLKDIARQYDNISTKQLMEYTGSNYIQAVKAINQVNQEKMAQPNQLPTNDNLLTEAELKNYQAQYDKKQKQLKRRKINPEKDTLTDAIIKLGGISPDYKLDTTGDTVGNKSIVGVGYLWSNKRVLV